MIAVWIEPKAKTGKVARIRKQCDLKHQKNDIYEKKGKGKQLTKEEKDQQKTG